MPCKHRVNKRVTDEQCRHRIIKGQLWATRDLLCPHNSVPHVLELTPWGRGFRQHPLGAQPGLQYSVFTVHIPGHHMKSWMLVPFCRWRKCPRRLSGKGTWNSHRGTFQNQLESMVPCCSIYKRESNFPHLPSTLYLLRAEFLENGEQDIVSYEPCQYGLEDVDCTVAWRLYWGQYSLSQARPHARHWF